MVCLKEERNMKKILIVNDLLYGGGTETVLAILAKTLRDTGHSVTILTYNKQSNYHRYQLEGVKYIHIGCPLPSSELSNKFKKLYFKVINLYSKLLFYYNNIFVEYDIVIAFKEGYITKLTSKLRGKQKKIAWVHTDFETFHWSKTSYKNEDEERRCYGLYDSIVTVSMKSSNTFIKLIGYEDKVKMIYNPLNFQEINSKAEKEIMDLRRPVNKKLFVAVGRLSEVKGFSSLLKIIKNLNKEYSDSFELWIIGDGELQKTLQNYINNNELCNVKLLGHKENPYQYMKKADYFICSSISESFGLSIVESMILGVPVISTKCGIVEEFITDKDLGIILNDLESLNIVIKELLEKKSSHIDVKKVIRKCYSNFSLEIFIQKINELIE